MMSMSNIGIRTEKHRSATLFWGTVLLLVPAVRNILFLRQRADVVAYVAIDIWSLIDIAGILWMAFIVFLHYDIIGKYKLFRGYLGLYFAYYIFAAFSILWCIGGNPYYIIFRAITMIVVVLYIAFLLSLCETARQGMFYILKLLTLIAVFGLINSINSNIFHAVGIALSAACGVILCLAMFRTRVGKYSELKWYFFLNLLIVIVSTSGGSNVALLVGLLVFLCGRNGRLSFMKICLLILPVYYLGTVAFEQLIPILFPGKSVSAIASGTGRLFIWEYYLTRIDNSAWLGFGFAVGEKMCLSDGFEFSSSHNGFLSVLINTGIVGCVIFGLFLFSFLMKLKRVNRGEHQYSFCILCCMAVIMTNNMTYPFIGSSWCPSYTGIAALLVFPYIFHNIFERENPRGSKTE